MFAVRARQTLSAILGNSVQFVQLILAQPFCAQSSDAKTETSKNQDRYRDKH